MDLYIDVELNTRIIKSNIDFMCVIYPDRNMVITWDKVKVEYNTSGFCAKCTGVKIDMDDMKGIDNKLYKLNKDIVRIELFDHEENRIHVESGIACFADAGNLAKIFFDDKYAFLVDYTKEEILEKVIFRPVNGERFKGRLEKSPHTFFLDLSVLFVIPENECNYITITNDMCKILHITKEELIEAAKENEKYKIYHIMDKLQEILDDIPCDFVTDDFPPVTSHFPMYVGTNQFDTFGASILMQPSAFYELSLKLKSNLYIFPCSVHEVVVVPTNDYEDSDTSYLKSMVSEINSTEVSYYEYLSDNVYIYDRKHNQISII